MQRLNTLWQILNAASTVRDIAQHTKTYHFAIIGPATFYLDAEYAEARITRWHRPMIEATVKLQGAFGWRIMAEQDDAGVYIAAKRRPLVGTLSGALFEVRVPGDTYLVLNLDYGKLILENVDGTLHIPPMDRNRQVKLLADALDD
jgi:hypothetical protein